MSRHTPRPRRGFTLGEMLIALILFSLVGGAILSLVMRQQRFYRSTAEIIKVQGQLRQGSSVLPMDLRALSTADTTANGLVLNASTGRLQAANYNADVYSRADKSIDFRWNFGSSMVCARPTAGATTLMLYPTALNQVTALTSWTHQPVVGDSLLVLDEGRMTGTLDDVWQKYEVRAVSPLKGNKGCPWKTGTDATPLLEAADTTTRSSYRIGIDRAISSTIASGAIVRFFRRVRYEAYQATNGQWYLGYSDCLSSYVTASKCSDVAPVSGPYAAYTGVASQNGITFTYYDSSGSELASAAASRLLTRVDVKMRTATATAVTRTGAGAGAIYRDSVLLSIGIRNSR